MWSYPTPSGPLVMLDDDVALPGRLSIGSHGYAQLTGVQARTVVLLHRWLMGCTKGDGAYVDHLNRNRLDCRRANLRVTDASGNGQNVPRVRGNSYRCRGRWQAKVKLLGKVHYLGTFDTDEEARAAAAAWRSEHFDVSN